MKGFLLVLSIFFFVGTALAGEPLLGIATKEKPLVGPAVVTFLSGDDQTLMVIFNGRTDVGSFRLSNNYNCEIHLPSGFTLAPAVGGSLLGALVVL